MPDQPPPKADITLGEALREDRREDCTPCKAIGAVAFMGLGAYIYVSGMSQLAAQEAEIARANTRFGIGIRRLGIQGMAAGLFGLGIYRAFFT
ncbi:hypothetical protein FN846DRAFT_908291 [Sphaerosporella brunnea]|uniref:Distal membrane-arm assembly complex protein 1-like domain-containing protein n=1 Tax=Sphaerosporella brunnea TaxID=1250544 RepID=A0A5J5EU55_9PEZI|nr:hypothetical protein FN846DRAFT_908291 [Sphaerosporella brunnea]